MVVVWGWLFIMSEAALYVVVSYEHAVVDGSLGARLSGV